MGNAHFLVSLAQAVAFLAVGLPLGDRILLRADNTREFSLVERSLMALVGGAVVSVIVMFGHIVSGGRALSNAWVVPLAAAAVLVWGRRSFRDLRIPRRHLLGILLLASVLILIYLVPALRGGSSVRMGDPPWHLGWTEQLLDGQPIPTGAAPGSVARNAYPWGFHAVLAFLVRLLPGSSPLIALDAVFMLLLAGIPLAASAVARRVDRRAGWGAAVAVSSVGGFGWLWARMPEFATGPREGRFGADLVVASPNSVYELFPPGLPREFGLVLLGAAMVAIAVAARGGRSEWARAGAVAGLVGLVSVPMFVSALLWLLVGIFLEPRARRRRALGWGLGSAMAVFGTWAAPVVVNYVAESGFVNITPRLGKEWPIFVALGSWGLLLVGAVYGGKILFGQREPQARKIFGAVVATGVLLVVAMARGVFDWGLGGNATLLHQGRVWPPAHLLAAVLAGVALAHLHSRGSLLSGRRLVASTALGAIGLASPVLASVELGTIASRTQAGFVYGTEDISGADSFVQMAAAHLPADAVVEVRGPDRLGFLLFQFSGARLARFDDPRLDENDLRIRYRDLAKQWDEQIAGDGFIPTYLVAPVDQGPSVVSGLATGEFEGVRYVLYPAD